MTEDKILYQGAEAKICKSSYMNSDVVQKRRINKKYRIKEIDGKLISFRTKEESKLIADARSSGVSVPIIYDVDLKNGIITMQYLDGKRIKDIFNNLNEKEREDICIKIIHNRRLMMANQKSILVIDDDPDVLSSLERMLESGNYPVTTALSGEDGLKKFKEEKPALVICDIMMEEISSGIDVVKQMREESKDAKIYILSSIGSLTASNIDVYQIGANGILQKPVNPDELLGIVKQTM